MQGESENTKMRRKKVGKEKRKEPDTVEDHVAVMNEVRHITCV